VTYASGGYVDTSVVVADLNQDGNPDLVMANDCATKACDTEGLVGVLLGNGDGTFQPASMYDSGGKNAQSIALGDVNRDGQLHILVAKEIDSIAELLGNGDGTFQPAVTVEVPGSHRVLVVADVNNDHNPDLVVPNYTANSVEVLLGNGDATFGALTSSDTGGLNVPSLAVADVNNDGALDVLAVNSCADFNCVTGTVAVLLGHADGTFQPAVTYDSGGNLPGSIAVGDINSDEKPDIVVANLKFDAQPLTGGGSAGVLLNSSLGPIPVRIDIKPGQVPNRVNPHSHALLRVALLATIASI
jgi:FG-GAP-like repeat